MVYEVKPTNKYGVEAVYRQVGITLFLRLQPEPGQSQETETRIKRYSKRKTQCTYLLNFIFIKSTLLIRVFEEGLKLVGEQRLIKKIKLDNLDDEIKQLMEESEKVAEEVEALVNKEEVVKEMFL